ncbi:cytochrome c oxidase assembly protein [Leifsonia sp. L25]|uniref:cytochrome c oxidase assembly protein n=1 Tax=Leifsonia sp. L25 TaxID=3423957 RepID=UPI003D69BF45
MGVVLALAYLCGVWRLLRLRLAWPWWRTTLFLTGCGVLVALTGTGLEGYGYRMFSVFMFQQLTLMMAIPPLLILGAPGKLLLKAAPSEGAVAIHSAVLPSSGCAPVLRACCCIRASWSRCS